MSYIFMSQLFSTFFYSILLINGVVILQETTQIYIEEVFQTPTTAQSDLSTLSSQIENSTEITSEFPLAHEVTYELKADSSRQSRQKSQKQKEAESEEKDENDTVDGDVEVTTTSDDSREGRQQSEDSSEEEEDGGGGEGNGGIGSLISAFLGSLSRVKQLYLFHLIY